VAHWEKLADRVIKTGIGTFGRPVVYFPQNHDCVQITGIFDNEFIGVDPAAGVPVDSSVPVLHVRLADLPVPPSPGDRVEIGEQLFRVISNQPDGQGASVLILHKI